MAYNFWDMCGTLIIILFTENLLTLLMKLKKCTWSIGCLSGQNFAFRIFDLLLIPIKNELITFYEIKFCKLNIK